MTDPNFFADVLDLASEVRLGVTEGRGLSPVRDTERASGGGELGGEGVVKSMTSCFETTEGDFARGVVRLTSIGVSSMTHVAISSSDSSSLSVDGTVSGSSSDLVLICSSSDGTTEELRVLPIPWLSFTRDSGCT